MTDMGDVQRWVSEHEIELSALAERSRADEQVVRLLAVLVVGGLSDDEIYEQLRELTPSTDGQHSPLAGAPELVSAVRHLAGQPG